MNFLKTTESTEDTEISSCAQKLDFKFTANMRHYWKLR